MKNIHILPTDKPSRLYKHNELGFKLLASIPHEIGQYNGSNQNIYITNSEEIKDGDWVLGNFPDNPIGKVISKYGEEFTAQSLNGDKYGLAQYDSQKIILTTDQDLIEDGVQSINDEFLEWFVKNPSCEEVETEFFAKFHNNLYKIIIPKEEPKQELELKDFDNSDILDVLNMGNVEYLGNGDIIYNPNLFFVKRGDKWFIKTEKPKQETLEEGEYQIKIDW